MKTFIAAFAALLLCGFANANERSGGPGSFFSSKEFSDSVFYGAYTLAKSLKAECTGDVSMRVTNAYRGPDFHADETGKPVGDSLILVKAELEGCPSITKFVTILYPNPQSGTPVLLPKTGFKGDTNGSIQLLFDVMRAVYPVAARKLQCEKATITEMEITQSPSGKRPAWTETWAFAGCGRTAIYAVRYQTDAKGETDFDAHLVQ